MAYLPPTKSGHNMFDMASLLQKAIRRGDFKRAGYAAYELYGNYSTMMWNRMMTISAEDCWGILTKELVLLRKKDEELNNGRKGYEKDATYVSRAIALMARAKKSRDACYFACNFILAPNDRAEIIVTDAEATIMKGWLDTIPDNIFNIKYLEENSQNEFEAYFDMSKSLTPKDESHETAVMLFHSIRANDMENIGYATDFMRDKYRLSLWKALLIIAVECGNGVLTKEIIGLKLTDDIVNKSKKPENRDEIFLSKAIMLLCYEQRKMCDSLSACSIVSPYKPVDWNKFEIPDISRCTLPDGIVPEYVYDVHTIKGKKLGKTDWGMNLVEQAALSPLQVSFFDEGSWGPRYDFKHTHNMCTEGEYLESLEYRKTRKGNPVTQLDADNRFRRCPYEQMDDFSKEIHSAISDGFHN